MGSSRYSPTPELQTDASGCIAKTNLAMQVLLGHDLAGCLKKPLATLSDKLAPRSSGEFFPGDLEQFWRSGDVCRNAERDWVRIHRVAYHSKDFGTVQLDNCFVPKISSKTGAPIGAFVYSHPLAIEDSNGFRRALSERWNHELMWEMYAASYDRVLLRLPFYRDMIQGHIDAILAAGAGNVLDIGVGTGNVTVPLLEAGCHVTSVDRGEAMLAHLAGKVDEDASSRLTLLRENAESLPDLHDETFDGVTISHVLYDMDHPELAWNEALRVLSPGGLIVVTEPNERFDLRYLLDSGEQSLKDQGLFEELKHDWARVSNAGHELKILERSARLHPSEIRQRLEAAGYQNISMDDVYLGSCSTVIGTKPNKPV